jgi:hypothetical protein
MNRLTDEQFKREFARFLDAQDVLSDFFPEAVPNEKGMLNFVLHSSFMVGKCYEAAHPGKAIIVGWQHLEAAIDDMKAWWKQSLANYDHLDAKDMEPLLRHILVELDALSRDRGLRSKEIDKVIRVMKSIMLAFERAAGDPFRAR